MAQGHDNPLINLKDDVNDQLENYSDPEDEEYAEINLQALEDKVSELQSGTC